tara:strand:+ start:290 stop:2014 length:1725 start_codon:yes stop_codon:yes gene_type:complete
MNINSLLEGASPYQNQQNEAAKLQSKWKRSGLLEGYSSETESTNMAVLLENQAKQLVNEASTAGTGTSITTGNSEAWAGVALPLVRRVFGEIVAKDLVSVQPMNLPSGLIFYLDFQYGSDQFNHASGQSIYGANSELTRNTLPGLQDVDQGLYGAGRFGYSLNETSSAVTSATSASADFLGILQGDSAFSASVSDAGGTFSELASSFYTVQVPLGTDNANFLDADFDAVKAWKVASATAAEVKSFYPQFTRINGTNVEFLVSGANDGALDTMTVTYPKGPDNLNDRGDFEDNGGNQAAASTSGGTNSKLDIPEINVQLRSDTVTAKTRKLKAQWTPEFAQDLNAYHSIDAEAELTSILSEYISMEIDLEILDMLIRNADTVEGWSAKIGTEITTANTAGTQAGSVGVNVTSLTSTTDTSGVYYTKMSWFQTLGVTLQKVSNIIHQKTLRGGANFMVVSPTVSTILESIPGFAADSPGDANKYAMGVQKIGAINSRYTVYKNPYMTENVILMGYKGNQFLETGAVFAPYIPLIMTPLVYDPSSFTPRKGIMTRYAKKMVRPDFYGKVLVSDLNLV